jgi:hypothetical protein
VQPGLRLALAVASGLIAGVVLGAFVTSSIYGTKEEKEAAIIGAVKCPPCPTCPAPSVPPKEAREDEEDAPGSLPMKTSTRAREIELPTGRPGLPASAIKLASEALRRALEPCIETARAGGAHGAVVLDLVITATSGIGHIRQASMSNIEGAFGGFEGCAIDAAKKVQFEWHEDDGESKLRYPVQLSP